MLITKLGGFDTAGRRVLGMKIQKRRRSRKVIKPRQTRTLSVEATPKEMAVVTYESISRTSAGIVTCRLNARQWLSVGGCWGHH